MNRFHPVYHSYTYLTGSRVDIERVLQPDLIDDPEDLIDQFSEPPHFFERLSPVMTHLGDTPIKGRNWTDMMLQCYRTFGRIFTRATVFLRQSLENNFHEPAMVPFMSLAVDPDTLVRLIDHDYEAGENSYGKLIELFQNGIVSPCITTPFHSILPLLPRAFDRRFCIRLALMFHAPILRAYEKYLERIGENQMVIGFWVPEGSITFEIIKMIHEEFRAFCTRKKFRKAHLVLLVSANQVKGTALDVLMKRWCALKMPEMQKDTTLIFCDPTFSDWMMNSHPSVKKMIDRTIAKVDVNLNAREIDYIWSHFESLEALTSSPRGAVNLEQRILKLCELNYLTVSPDTFVRRKLNGKFGVGDEEPMPIALHNRSPLLDPCGEESNYGRWRGWGFDGPNKNLHVMPDVPYVRKLRRGSVKCQGSPGWKIAWNLTRDTCLEQITSKSAAMKDGVFGILTKLTGAKDADGARQNVEEFLTEYSLIYWREHFLQHDMTEADIRLDDIVARTLRKGNRKPATTQECVTAACAAQAYYFALDSYNSYALDAANLDQRAMFQNVVMLTLAFCNAIAAFHYSDNTKKAEELATILKRELIDFSSAFERYNLAAYGVDRAVWEESLKPEVPDSTYNVVERAARRTAARQMGEFGYNELFPEKDVDITTNVGHNWTVEVNNPNYRWANPLFCGVSEE